MRLAELQRAFWSAVRTRGAPPTGLEDWLTGSVKQTPTARLAVYHLAYWQRQASALTATFPRTVALLGSERLLLAYVQASPGTHPCIERLGQGFVQFLAARRDISVHALGLARLEWAETESLLAPDPLAVAELPRQLGPKLVDCKLEFAPSVRVEHVPCSSFATFAGQVEANDASATIDVAFFRPEHAVLHRALQADEAHAHALAREGATIALICAAFSQLPAEQASARALQVLTNWFARGWVTRCNL
jgi:hypothetical protein